MARTLQEQLRENLKKLNENKQGTAPIIGASPLSDQAPLPPAKVAELPTEPEGVMAKLAAFMPARGVPNPTSIGDSKILTALKDQFTFTNPIPEIKKAYDEGGVAGVLENRLQTGLTGLKEAISPSSKVQSPTTSDVAVNNLDNRIPIDAGITTNTDNTSGRVGYAPRQYYDASGNEVASGLSSAIKRGGFVGAATDAAAAKAIQDRVSQDQATNIAVNRFDKQIEAIRNARAEKMGVSRGVLDRLENRDSAAAQEDSAAQGAIPDRWLNPLAAPGDSFQDTQRRQATYEQAIDQALTGSVRRQPGALGVLSSLNTLGTANQNAQALANKSSGGQIDPVSMNRFLLDQQKFGYQQGIDKDRLQIDAGTLQDKKAATMLQQKKYDDDRKIAFMEKFSYPDKNAPQEQLGALILSLSDTTGGVIPPEIMSGYVQKVATNEGIDWKDAPPKSLVELGKKAMALATQDYKGK